MTKIYIYGLSDVYYDAFYIKGLKEFYNVRNVFFNCKKFPKFNQGTFAVIVVQDNKEFKICIDSRDQSDLWIDALNWCDVYGKVNYNKNSLPEINQDKVLPIGPSFGIKIWSFPKTLFVATINYIRFKNQISRSKLFISNYLAQSKRERIESYFEEEVYNNAIKKYVFFASTLWKNENQTNTFRANFIKACLKNSRIEFEGGFVPRSDGNNLDFDDIMTNSLYSMSSYLKQIKKSDIVFNTPAVLNCHGWKLGEFLALGKVILSTSFYNQMPVKLMDKENILFLEKSDENEISIKLDEIINSEELQLHLKQQSKLYFQMYLQPKKVIERLNEMYLSNSKND